MALFSGLINAGTKALRAIYNNTFYDTEESIDVSDLLEEFINGFTGGGILGTAMIIVGLIAHTTLLKMYIILTGISVVLGVIQTVIAAYKGDEFGVALSVIFTTLSLIAFGNLYAYNKYVSVKHSEGIEQTVKTDASGENLEVKSEPTPVEDTPKAGDAGQGGSKYVKASFWERIRTKTAKVGDIYPNPLDEFSNPQIGPNESAVSRYIKEINTNGTISEPIEVQKLSSGGYEIVNGHHRWLAAIKTGLKEVPIKIVNYEN